MKKKNNALLWRILRKSHSYIGLSSGLVLLMLALTGITLNHTETLKLDSHFVQNKHLLDWYGIVAPKPKRVFKTPTHYLSQLNNQLFLNEKLILNLPDLLQGAIETKNFIAVAFTDSILLVSLEGEVIEQIERPNLTQIGINNLQHIFIKQSEVFYRSDDALLTWTTTDTKKIQWSKIEQLPVAIENSIRQQYRSRIIPLERIFLDLHSGRFFGNIGVIIVDICGVLLILLVLSGLSLWLKYNFKK